jgi:phosphoribosylanthranilate isomerase
MRTFVKICGITNMADARVAASSGADFLGFIFTPRSPRFIAAGVAAKIIRVLPASVKKVGVFVNEAQGRVKTIASACGLDLLQFHGDEDASYIKGFKGYRVIKAVRVKDAAALKNASYFKPDYFLLDAFQKNIFGGTGRTFDWGLLDKMKGFKAPVLVSGGLTPENVGELLGRIQPFGVDVSSGVELRPGKKSVRLVKKFISVVRGT